MLIVVYLQDEVGTISKIHQPKSSLISIVPPESPDPKKRLLLSGTSAVQSTLLARAFQGHGLGSPAVSKACVTKKRRLFQICQVLKGTCCAFDCFIASSQALAIRRSL